MGLFVTNHLLHRPQFALRTLLSSSHGNNKFMNANTCQAGAAPLCLMFDGLWDTGTLWTSAHNKFIKTVSLKCLHTTRRVLSPAPRTRKWN